MFPIRVSTSSRRVPVFTIGLLLANAVVFWHQINLHLYEVRSFLMQFGVVPSRAQADPAGELVPLVTCMFLHGSMSHVVGNMWYLWLFGDGVEGRLGRFEFLTFYFVSGLAATATHVLANAGSQLPIIGASGAIAGVLGAYLYMFPTATVTTKIILGPVVRTVEVPAAFFLGIWIFFQIGQAVADPQAGIAWYAHIGGFAAGLLLAVLMSRR